MLRVLAVLAITCSVAHADLRTCAEKAIAALPDARERAQLALDDAPPNLDAREKEALADKYDVVGALGDVVEDAVRAGDMARANRLVDRMEREAAAHPPQYDFDVWRREAKLALANALAKRTKQARAHVDAVKAKLPQPDEPAGSSAHRELMIIALVLGDDAFARAEETAFLDAVKKGRDRGDIAVAARFVAYAGFGKRVLGWIDVDKRERDRVLAAILEGVKARKDLPLALDILTKLDSARSRMLELEQISINLSDRERHTAAFISAVKAALAVEGKPDVDDFARGELVQVLAGVGLTTEALAVAGRIKNSWERARGEAETAAALALVDRKAAIALARRALDRAATPGYRTDVSNDTSAIDTAKWRATSAFARAGELAEATKLGKPYPIDVVLGLRDRTPELAAWWQRASKLDRARVLHAAVRGHAGFEKPAFLDAVCTN